MTDFIVYPLAFGGTALEPVTDRAKQLLQRWRADNRQAVYATPDACMTGFSDDTLGFEPHDAEDVVQYILNLGFTLKRAF